MTGFISDFYEKVKEINKYFNFVWLVDNLRKIENVNITPKIIYESDNTSIKHELNSFLDENNSYKIDNELVKILKANCYLILYNLVEGAITTGINALFVAFNSKNGKYKDFKNEIQQIWVKYKKYSHETLRTVKLNETSKFFVETMENIFNEKVEISPKNIGSDRRIVTDYEAYLHEIGQSNEISGNLDAKKIRELSNLYGLPEYNTTKAMFSLVEVKNKRNSLAHGRSNFSEEGRIPIEELILMRDEIIIYLEQVLLIFENHINSEKFMK